MPLRRCFLRLMLLLLPWLVILGVPQFRVQLRNTLTGNHYAVRQGIGQGLFADWFRYERGSPEPKTVEERALNITWGVGEPRVREEGDRILWYMKQFGALSDQYPHEAWLLALAFRHFAVYMDGRNEYQWANAQYYRPLGSSRSEVKPETLAEAFRLLRRAQSLEPDNAFFDWVRVRLLLIARRDREALEALQVASTRPRYNEHFKELMRAHAIALRERMGALPDEQIATDWNISVRDLRINTHARGTILWRISQLERAKRYDEAIAAGTALRRLCAMQMISVPNRSSNQAAANGLAEVWARNDPQVIQKTRPDWESVAAQDRAQVPIIARKYFRYLSQHGHSELVPEARAQFQRYMTVKSWPRSFGPNAFAASRWNFNLALTGAWWDLGVLALFGVLVSAGAWCVLFPFGCRADFRGPEPIQWPPTRKAFYPQLLGWGGAALCAGQSGYQLLLGQWQEWGGYDIFANALVWGVCALGLPFGAALVTQVLGLRREKVVPKNPDHWVPGFRELGMPPGLPEMVFRAWGIFRLCWLAVGLLFLPLTAADAAPDSVPWLWSNRDFQGLYLVLQPYGGVCFAPVLLISWMVIALASWRAHSRVTYASKHGAIRGFRRYCGAYVTVFSWLLLLVFVGNLWPEAALARDFPAYLNQEATLSIVKPARVQVPAVLLALLPPIPAFATPTPAPPVVYPMPVPEAEE